MKKYGVDFILHPYPLVMDTDPRIWIRIRIIANVPFFADFFHPGSRVKKIPVPGSASKIF